MAGESQWRRCSACKQPIEFGSTYWTCNVSTCNRKRTGLAFCTVSCWEVHLPSAHHRESWAVEQTAPRSAEAVAGAGGSGPAQRGRRRIVASPPARQPDPKAPTEVLVIASRLKEYVRTRAGFNTSERALEPLSEILRRACDEAIENARRDGRKTVLDRDIRVG